MYNLRWRTYIRKSYYVVILQIVYFWRYIEILLWTFVTDQSEEKKTALDFLADGIVLVECRLMHSNVLLIISKLHIHYWSPVILLVHNKSNFPRFPVDCVSWLHQISLNTSTDLHPIWSGINAYSRIGLYYALQARFIALVILFFFASHGDTPAVTFASAIGRRRSWKSIQCINVRW